MKTISKILAATFVLAFASKSNAQSTASADALATIITPIAIVKDVDMNFGNVAVQSTSSGTGAAGGTVVLTPAGARSVTGGVSLPATAGTVTAAKFDVTGDGTRTFSITLPSTPVTLTRQSGTQTMTVTAFTSTPSGTGTLTAGAASVNVGGTLNVAIDQTPGVYEGAFEVTVNYN